MRYEYDRKIKNQADFDKFLAKELDGPIGRLKAAGIPVPYSMLLRKAFLLYHVIKLKDQGIPFTIDKQQALEQIRQIGEELTTNYVTKETIPPKPLIDDSSRATAFMLQGKKEEFVQMHDAMMAKALNVGIDLSNRQAAARIGAVEATARGIKQERAEFDDFAKVFPSIVKLPENPKPEMDVDAIAAEVRKDRNPFLNNQAQFDKLLKAQNDFIAMMDGTGVHAGEETYITKACIYYDALMAKENKAAPINIDRAEARANIIACGQEIIRVNDIDRAQGSYNDVLRARGYIFQGKRKEFDQLLQDMMTQANTKGPEAVRIAQQNVAILQQSFEKYAAVVIPVRLEVNVEAEPPLPEDDDILEFRLQSPKEDTQSAAQAPSDTIDKQSFAKILKEYKTSSWFYFIFSCFGLTDKRSATITALFTLLNKTDANAQISKADVEAAINTEGKETTKAHRSNLFKQGYQDQKDGTSTDEIIDKLAKEFSKTGPK